MVCEGISHVRIGLKIEREKGVKSVPYVDFCVPMLCVFTCYCYPVYVCCVYLCVGLKV